MTALALENIKNEGDQEFRGKILALEEAMKRDIAAGELENVEPQCELKHMFTGKTDYGCHVYARQFFMPKGALVVGKIHRHEHLNFILKGRVAVVTEFGKDILEAPMTFISKPGTKRTVLVLEDCIWTTIHLTKYAGEENLSAIENEVIASSYKELEQSRKPQIIFEVMP